MSRKAKKPIDAAGVTVNIKDRRIQISGTYGSLEMPLKDNVQLEFNDDKLFVSSNLNAFAGLYHALITNMIVGVKDRFKETLTLNGVGYKVSLSGKTLNLNLGYSHPTKYELNEMIDAVVISPTEIDLYCADKQYLGQVCSEIISMRPAKKDPYKHKGIKKKSTVLIKKAGKKVG